MSLDDLVTIWATNPYVTSDCDEQWSLTREEALDALRECAELQTEDWHPEPDEANGDLPFVPQKLSMSIEMRRVTKREVEEAYEMDWADIECMARKGAPP